MSIYINLPFDKSYKFLSVVSLILIFIVTLLWFKYLFNKIIFVIILVILGIIFLISICWWIKEDTKEKEEKKEPLWNPNMKKFLIILIIGLILLNGCVQQESSSQQQSINCEEAFNRVTSDCYWNRNYTEEESEYCRDKIAFEDQDGIPHTYGEVDVRHTSVNHADWQLRSIWVRDKWYEEKSYTCLKGDLHGTKLTYDESKKKWVVI